MSLAVVVTVEKACDEASLSGHLVWTVITPFEAVR